MGLIISPQTVTEAQILLSDVTTDDVSSSKHGFAPKNNTNTFDFLSGNGTYIQPINYPLRSYSLLGGATKAEPFGLNIFNLTTGALALTSQQVRFVAVYLPTAQTITGVRFFQSTQGSYTANNYNGVGLYSYSAGTLTLVASSTDDPNIWKATSNTWSNKDFSGTYPAVAGLYFIAALYCSSAQVTAPTLVGGAAFANANVVSMDFSNSAKIAGSVSSLTALPSPSQAMSSVVVGTNNFYFALY